MAHLLPYLAKVILISAILYAYYFIALRNNIYHRYNRFYLLSGVLLAILLPLVKLEYLIPAQNEKVPAFLHRYVMLDNIVITPAATSDGWTASQFMTFFYLLIAAILLITFLLSVYHVVRLKQRGHSLRAEDLTIIKTTSPEAPFSFFSWIFVEQHMHLGTAEAERILNHERVHVRQWHTIDKLFMNIAGILFWFNPFFWLIKRELNMVHEFLADRSAFRDGDTGEFSKLTLNAVYAGYQWPVVNSFFYSPLKRRLMMILKNKKQKVGYFWRIMALPVSAVLVLTFSARVSATAELTQMDELVSPDAVRQSDVISPADESSAGVSAAQGAVDTMPLAAVKHKQAAPAPPPPPPPAPPLESPIPPAPPAPDMQGAPVYDTVPKERRIFSKVEKEAQFPGGAAAWARYITNAIQKSIDSFTERDYGTCVVKFIVDENGNVSNVAATTMKGTTLARISVDAIRKGPRWIPAEQGGKTVAAYRLQPVTLKQPDKKVTDSLFHGSRSSGL